VIRWQLVKSEAVLFAVTTVLERLSRSGIDDQTMSNVKKVLKDRIMVSRDGTPINWTGFASDLDVALGTAA